MRAVEPGPARAAPSAGVGQEIGPVAHGPTLAQGYDNSVVPGGRRRCDAEHVVYRLLADAVMLIHFGFLAFVALGGFVAWRYRWVLVPHVVAAVWGALTVTVGLECPLTTWESALRRLGDQEGLPRGFIDTYLTGVVYPQEYLPAVQLLVAALVVASWVGLATRSRRPAPHA